MARKNCYEQMEAYYADALREVSEERLIRDPASYFINAEMIRKTKRISRGNERLFHVRKDGSLSQRADEFS